MSTCYRLAAIFSLLLATGCYASTTSSGDGHHDTPDLQPDYQPDNSPDYRPDYAPDYPPDYWPDYLPDYWPDYLPDYYPDYRPDYYPDYYPDYRPDMPGCYASYDCGYRQFCDFPAGYCSGPGVCSSMDVGPCPPVYDPVCGCDLVTYPDDCSRRAAGVSVLRRGECDAPGCFPGDPYGVCGDSSFCEGPPGLCGIEGVTGWCEPYPDLALCPAWDPVCGCDGVTYANDCERKISGIWMNHWGECEWECFPGDPYGVCAPEEFCEGPEGLCDMVGPTGWCQIPDMSCGWLWDPVCGCNYVTYPNDCERQRAGVWRRHWGPCPTYDV